MTLPDEISPALREARRRLARHPLVRPRVDAPLRRSEKPPHPAEASDGIVVSVATIVDLWYVTQTTADVTADDLARLTERLSAAHRVDLHPIDAAVVRSAISIPRALLTDPWDRFIVATALALEVPLVTRDAAVHQAQLVETIW